jgi:hypothetical protein
MVTATGSMIVQVDSIHLQLLHKPNLNPTSIPPQAAIKWLSIRPCMISQRRDGAFFLGFVG